MKVNETNLIHTIEIKVRFSEVDSLRMVWHGNYVQYLEDAREEWGRHFGLGYMDMYDNGFVAPLYDLQMHYRGVASINDQLQVKITYCNSQEGSLVFHYEIRNVVTDNLILVAESVQLFITTEGEFYPAAPEFYQKWKIDNGLC